MKEARNMERYLTTVDNVAELMYAINPYRNYSLRMEGVDYSRGQVEVWIDDENSIIILN